MFGFQIATVLVVFEALEQFVLGQVPAFFLEVHFATALFDDAHGPRVVDDSTQLGGLGIDSFESLFVFDFGAQLDFQREHFQQKITFVLVVAPV